MTLTVRLDPELEKALQRHCEKTGATKSRVITKLLRDHLDRQKQTKSAYEIAEELGIIGCDKSPGPTDMARNAKRYLAEAIRAKHSR
ncbi:MAG: ribbon-helix-helix protein, CopG family [Burkholderiales bacterium]